MVTVYLSVVGFSGGVTVDDEHKKTERRFYWRGVIVVVVLLTPLVLGLLAILIIWIRNRL